MRPGFVALATVLLCLTVPAARADRPPLPGADATHSQQVTKASWGNVCYDGPNGEYRCRYFSVSEQTNLSDGSHETRLDYTFTRSTDTLWAYRQLNCTLDPRSLTVRPNGAVFEANIPDPTVDTCQNSGMLCDADGCTDWSWAEPVVVKGEMSSPGVEQTQVTIQSNRDNDTGVSIRQQCNGGYGWNLHGGGVSFSTAGGNLLYFPFGYTGQYGQASGAYMYDKCNQITN